MSIYKILPLNTGEEKLDGATLLDVTKLSSASKQVDVMRVDESLGADKLRWVTGLEERDIKFSKVLTQEQRELYLKQLQEDLPKIAQKLSPEQLDQFNKAYWVDSGVATLELSPAIQNIVFDTEKNTDYLIRRYAILAGAYDMVAPNEEFARRFHVPYYMSTLEQQEFKKATPVNEKLKAFSELNAFLTTASETQLRWFCWALDKTTQGFSAINTHAVMSEKLVEFLEGKLTKSTNTKGEVAKKLLEKLEQWKVNKESVITEGVFYAAIAYGNIYREKGFYYTTERRTKLHASIEDSLEMLKDPQMREELVELQDAVKQEFNRN